MDDVDDDDGYSRPAATEATQSHPAAPFTHGDLAESYDDYLRRFLLPRFTRLAALRLDRSEPVPPLSWVARDDRDRYHNYLDGDFGADGGGGFGAVPASGVAVACLTERTAGDGEEAECTVCLEGYETGQAVRRMPCGHEFHEGCIFGWLRVSHLCPLCRFALPAEF